MKSANRIITLGLVLFASAASAAPDLSVSIVAPSGVNVYATARYAVNVKNVGNQKSNGGSLQIDLPKTNTSPTVYTLGQVGAFTPGCTRSGSRITCSVSATAKLVTRPFYVDFAGPQNSAPLVITARIVPSMTSDAAGNDVATHTLALVNPSQPITSDLAVENQHCTGTGLTSFFECALFPSSISDHPTTLYVGGTLGFGVDVPSNYTGTWSQPATNRLNFKYFEDGLLVADFIGFAVGGGCFEGVTTFPGSAYVSPYEVCPL